MGTWRFEANGSPGAISLNGNNYLATVTTQPDQTLLAGQLSAIGAQMTTNGAPFFSVVCEGQTNKHTTWLRTLLSQIPPIGNP